MRFDSLIVWLQKYVIILFCAKRSVLNPLPFLSFLFSLQAELTPPEEAHYPYSRGDIQASRGKFCRFFSSFIAVENTKRMLVERIRLSADTIRKPADSLIVFSNAIRIFTHCLMAFCGATIMGSDMWTLTIEKERTCPAAGSLFAWRGGPC